MEKQWIREIQYIIRSKSHKTENVDQLGGPKTIIDVEK